MNNLVSVIIPTYNRSGFIVECIESVINQTYKVHEIIVIDDNSNDETYDKLKPYIYNKKIIYHKMQMNVGPSNARKYGIDHATGRFVAFLDSDDIWEIDKLDIQLNLLINNNYKCVASQIIDLDLSNNTETLRGHYDDKKSLLFQLLSEKCSIPMSTIIIEKNVLQEFQVFKETGINFLINKQILYFGDHFELLLKISLLEDKFYFLNKPLAKYKRHSNNISNYIFGSSRSHQ
jgi:glycosyltransferase involved in cell wall biosynthesis